MTSSLTRSLRTVNGGPPAADEPNIGGNTSNTSLMFITRLSSKSGGQASGSSSPAIGVSGQSERGRVPISTSSPSEYVSLSESVSSGFVRYVFTSAPSLRPSSSESESSGF